MYHLDGKRRRQPLVYFGEPQVSSANVAGGALRAGYDASKFQWPRGQLLARRVRLLLIATRAADTSLAEKRVKPGAELAL